MPAGDPAGYLPKVRRARKRRGQSPYQPRSKRSDVYGSQMQPGSAPKPHFGPMFSRAAGQGARTGGNQTARRRYFARSR